MTVMTGICGSCKRLNMADSSGKLYQGSRVTVTRCKQSEPFFDGAADHATSQEVIVVAHDTPGSVVICDQRAQIVVLVPRKQLALVEGESTVLLFTECIYMIPGEKSKPHPALKCSKCRYQGCFQKCDKDRRFKTSREAVRQLNVMY